MNCMGILVNFEDSYGIADIACNEFFKSPLDANIEECKYGDVIVRRRLANCVFMPTTLPANIDTIIFVYDMDRLSLKSKDKILASDTLANKIAYLQKYYVHKELRFVPVAFCAETICLHLLKDYCYDYSEVFSLANTAHLHTKILHDKLSAIHTDKTDTKFWKVHGADNHTLKIKNTRNFFGDFEDIQSVVKEIYKLGISKENRTLFRWLESSDIHNTDILLNANEAVELQKKYKETYDKFIEHCDNKQITIQVGKKAVSYNLATNYKV